eukprot:5890326-Prymnesium_polylepis.1
MSTWHIAPPAAGTFEHVLQGDDLAGLARIFASNLDGVPQAIRLERSSRAEALRHERLSMESAARRRAELAQHVSKARVMGWERRVTELRAEALERKAQPAAAPRDVSSGGSAGAASLRAQLEAARRHFTQHVEELGPSLDLARQSEGAKLVDQLRSQRLAVEARRSESQAVCVASLRVEAEIDAERERLRQAHQ